MIDLRFPTALQVMLSLLHAEREGMACVSSAELAKGLGANPSFVRKLLVPLVQQGLLLSSMGKHGGVSLARPADETTLREIYEAVTEGKKLFQGRPDVPHRCVVSSNFERYFEALAADADRAVLEVLGNRTLAQSFAALETLDKRPSRPSRPKSRS